MEYINSSIRKISTFITSPPPGSVLGERRSCPAGDLDQDEERNSACLETSPSRNYASSGKDPYYGVCRPQPPQKRTRRLSHIERRAEVLQNANEAIRKAQIAMGAEQSTEVVKSNIQEELTLQEELELQFRQEEDARTARLMHQKKSQPTTTNRKKSLNAESSDVEQPRLPLQAEQKQPPSPSNLHSPRLQELHSTPPWEALPPTQKWSTQPKRYARDLLSSNGNNASAIPNALHEPASVCYNTEIRDGLRQLTFQIRDLAASYFGFPADVTRLRSVLSSLPRETVGIIGCVASGGPGGAKGWASLFLEAEKREALVCAVVGNVVVEQVFQHLFFGGTEEQVKAMGEIQFTHRHEDGTYKQVFEEVGCLVY